MESIGMTITSVSFYSSLKEHSLYLVRLLRPLRDELSHPLSQSRVQDSILLPLVGIVQPNQQLILHPLEVEMNFQNCASFFNFDAQLLLS